MKYLLLVLLLLFIAPHAHAAIALDTSGDCGSASSCSVTVTGSNTILFAEVDGDVGGIAGAVSCTYGGVAMTALDSQTTPSDRTIYDFYIVGKSGANTLACAGATFVRIISASYTGVSQTAPVSHTSTSNAAASSLSTTLTASTASDWAILFNYRAGGTFTAGTGVITTSRHSGPDGNNIADSNGGTLTVGSNSVGFTNSISSSISLAAVDITPAFVFTPIPGLKVTIQGVKMIFNGVKAIFY